jgi:hypothetical protein
MCVVASSFVEYAYAAIVEGIAYDEAIFRTDVVGFNMIHSLPCKTNTPTFLATQGFGETVR